MSDTPETDKVWKADDVVARIMLSRKLERERDRAIAEVERLKAGGCARDQRTTQFCAEAVTAIRERDEARQDAQNYYLKVVELQQKLKEYDKLKS